MQDFHAVLHLMNFFFLSFNLTTLPLLSQRERERGGKNGLGAEGMSASRDRCLPADLREDKTELARVTPEKKLSLVLIRVP